MQRSIGVKSVGIYAGSRTEKRLPRSTHCSRISRMGTAADRQGLYHEKDYLEKEFEIEKGRFSFRLTAPYREERRRAASEAAKNE